MNRSNLIAILAVKQDHLSDADIEAVVKAMLEQLSATLASGGRIEIRGFGSFSLHRREPRRGRNPKTGELVDLPTRYVPHFKPGKALRERVDEAFQRSSSRPR